SPPRETYRGSRVTSTSTPAGVGAPALVTTTPSTSTRPAMISAWARLRVSARPRSTRTASSLGRVGIRTEPVEQELAGTQAATFVEADGARVPRHDGHLKVGNSGGGEPLVDCVHERAAD